MDVLICSQTGQDYYGTVPSMHMLLCQAIVPVETMLFAGTLDVKLPTMQACGILPDRR